MSDQLFIGLRALILSLFPSIEVIQGLGNNVPMPANEFIALTAAGQRRLRTDQETYGVNTKSLDAGIAYRIQIDCYGADSSDQATALSIILNDAYACDLLLPYGCQPLETSDPTQSALVNGEENYEQRWMFAVMLQFNPVITVSQEFADTIKTGIVNADTIPQTEVF